ncbi:pyruvate kinase [Novosphingobium beihaiensis]|uniref:Pyruvate kinase n=1 Tax=Novosphingobium beihaiensis TaxID=2930389 RepID=A0ABT0BPC6_9SPHN|nr:pyruvate kinase [Novosphingobium beihaiensis]MCJ2186882.1 pyruvate kinase [Novosphingobium beihaiensis]
MTVTHSTPCQDSPAPLAGAESADLSAIADLKERIETLTAAITAEAEQRLERWAAWDIRGDFQPSAENLAAYLAFRHHDLRDLQRRLMALGLSSLGRLESRVLPTLHAVQAALAAMLGTPPPSGAAAGAFFAGEERLRSRALALLGLAAEERQAALLVTCPSEAADDPAFMDSLAQRGVEALRINCAHDGADQWLRMIAHARTAQQHSGHRFRIFMDLAGPKNRTGTVRATHDTRRVFAGDRIAMTAPGQLQRAVPPETAFVFECLLPEVIDQARPGQRLLIDDGKIEARIDSAGHGLLVATVSRTKEKGGKLKPEKGINLPDTELHLPALTAKDREDIAFIAEHADGLSFSFVQTPDDVVMLQDALAALPLRRETPLALVLKIETALAVQNLPDIIMRAGARNPVAIMIARGDLAIEIGFARLAEMQEEILWIAEAAQVPVIWATQVLEQLVKEGLPHRGELTDAAMAARAECVMLNKGPHLLEAIDALDPLLERMEGHIHKKTPQLRRLASW